MPLRKACEKCGRMTLYVSWSALRTAEECKQKGFLNRTGKKATMENMRVFFPGTVTDRVVRDWLLEDPYNNPGRMPEMVEAIMKREADLIDEGRGKLIWKDASDRESVLRDCIEAVTKIEPALNKLVLPYDYDVDFRFKAPVMMPHPSGDMEQVVLNGAMDIITRDDNGRYSVWDVKHTRDNYYWKKTKGQLSFYDLSVQVMFEQETIVTGLLQPLCDEQVKPFPLTQDDRSQLMQRVMAMSQDVWRKNFAPEPTPEKCMFCNVKHACSLFTPVTKDGKKKMNLVVKGDH